MRPLAVTAVLIAACSPAAAEVTIRLSEDAKAVEVAGLTGTDEAAAAGKLKVVVGGGTAAEVAARPAIPGTAKLAGGVLRFTPRFPLTPGVTYRATYETTSADLTVPKPDRKPTTTIAEVHPTAATLPENTLRWYVYFSAPMTKGGVYKYVSLLNESGKPVTAPFLELDEELWTADGKRFTLLFDPGRVKRGLKPREEAGPVLEEGKKFTLVIDPAWEDENGVPLKEGFKRTVSVGPPDDKPIDPDKWEITPPKLGARPLPRLTVRFEKPLDRALLDRMIWVVGPDGKRLDGTITVPASADSWSFRAARDEWPVGEYKLVVDTRLEDPCGNRVGRPFEIDVFHPIPKKVEGKTVERGFMVR